MVADSFTKLVEAFPVSEMSSYMVVSVMVKEIFLDTKNTALGPRADPRE